MYKKLVYSSIFVFLAFISSCTNNKEKVMSDDIKIDKKLLLEKLTIAFADEWVAAYQYWLAAKFIHGPSEKDVIPELVEHYNDEIRHAGMIADRIRELGGTLNMVPREWQSIGKCDFDAISNTNTTPVLHENIKGERCAIEYYSELLKMVDGGKDTLTYKIIKKILDDEIEHEMDLKKLLKKLPK